MRKKVNQKPRDVKKSLGFIFGVVLLFARALVHTVFGVEGVIVFLIEPFLRVTKGFAKTIRLKH
jgi:membrane-bound ClpP family serine protease